MDLKEKYTQYNFKILQYNVTLDITENKTSQFYEHNSVIRIIIPYRIDYDYLSYKLNELAINLIYNKYFDKECHEDDNMYDLIDILSEYLQETNVLSKALYNEIIKRIYSYEIENDYR